MKLKMPRNIKIYPITQSPLYKLSTKKKLASLLNVTSEKLYKLIDDSNYNVFTENGREIQEPKADLKKVHEIIKELLSRVEKPEFLFSGVKRRSAITNAKFHLDNQYIMTTDISSFYRSSKDEYVFRFFYYNMKMQEDTARILTNILCYHGFIPTGSPSSQLIAFFAYSDLFHKIHDYAEKNNIRFSLYVDDLTFSSNSKIPKIIDLKINSLLQSCEHKIKKKKTKFYQCNQSKVITGCKLTNKNEVKVLNKHKKKIIDLLKEYYKAESKEKKKISKSILGTIAYVQQIEPELFKATKDQLRLEIK